MLEITAARVYVRRDGGLARIYATDGGGGARVHGAVFLCDGWFTEHWTKTGYYWGACSGGKHDYDLISEYDWRKVE